MGSWTLRNNRLVGRGRPWVADIINQAQGLGASLRRFRICPMDSKVSGCQVHGYWPERRGKVGDRLLAKEAIDWGRARESSGGDRELVGAAGSMQQNEGPLLFVVDKDLSLQASPSTAH